MEEEEEKEKNEDGRIKVKVMKGYMGQGKKKIINRIMKEKKGKRYEVIVNELGEIGIDKEIIVEQEEEI